MVAVRQREVEPGAEIAFARRQRLLAGCGGAGVEGQHHAQQVAVLIRFIQLHHLQARPVVRARQKQACRGVAQEGQRQPELIQQAQRLLQRIAELRPHHFGGLVAHGRQLVFAALGLPLQAQQRAAGGLAHEFAGKLGVQQRRQGKVQKLNAAVLNQRNAVFVVRKGCQHHLLSRLNVMG